MSRYRERQTLVTDKNVKPANYSSEWKIEIKKKHFCPINLTAECIACNHRGWNRYRSFVLVLSWQAAHLCLRSLLAAGLTQPPLLSRFGLGLDFNWSWTKVNPWIYSQIFRVKRLESSSFSSFRKIAEALRFQIHCRICEIMSDFNRGSKML